MSHRTTSASSRSPAANHRLELSCLDSEEQTAPSGRRRRELCAARREPSAAAADDDLIPIFVELDEEHTLPTGQRAALMGAIRRSEKGTDQETDGLHAVPKRPYVVLLSRSPDTALRFSLHLQGDAHVRVARDLPELCEAVEDLGEQTPLALVLDYRENDLEREFLSLCDDVLPAGATVVVWKRNAPRTVKRCQRGSSLRWVGAEPECEAEDLGVLSWVSASRSASAAA